ALRHGARPHRDARSRRKTSGARPRHARAIPEMGQSLRRDPARKDPGADGSAGRDGVLGRREAEVARQRGMADGKPSCCARRPAGEPAVAPAAIGITPSRTPIVRRWSPLIGGSFRMGSNDQRFPDDGEGPVREVSLSFFAIACYAVSNLQFAEFVRQTGYTTDAERYGWSFVFEGLLSDEAKREPLNRAAETP